MGIDVARGVRHARHIEPLVMQGLLVGELAWPEHVFEPPDLGDGREVEPLWGGHQPHGAHEVALEHRKPAVEQGTDQHELAGLIGGERDAEAVGGEEVDEATRGGDGALLLLLAGRPAALLRGGGRGRSFRRGCRFRISGRRRRGAFDDGVLLRAGGFCRRCARLFGLTAFRFFVRHVTPLTPLSPIPRV